MNTLLQSVRGQLRYWLVWSGYIAIRLVVHPFLPRSRFPPGHDVASAKDRITRILVFRQDEIGDCVLSSAFFRELRGNFPAAEITVVTHPAMQPLFKNCPYLNTILAYVPPPTFHWPWGRLSRYWHSLAFAYSQLAPRRFDIAILPRVEVDLTHATLLAVLCNIPVRAGFGEHTTPFRQAGNCGYDSLLTHVFTPPYPLHEVDATLQLLRFLGLKVESIQLEFWAEAADQMAAAAKLAQLPDRHPRFALCIGAGHPKRKWPTVRYFALIRHLIEIKHASFVVFGGKAEAVEAQKIADTFPQQVITLAGKTSLLETACLIAQCDLYLGHDTGGMHMAAAAKTPVVELSCHPQNGLPQYPNSPLRYGPWQVPSLVLQPHTARPPCTTICSAATAHCILELDEPSVLLAILSFCDTLKI